jgi:hypothetical protein
VPVGAGAPAGTVIVAVSVNVWPIVSVASLTTVAIAGVAGWTTTVSLGSLQAPETVV